MFVMLVTTFSTLLGCQSPSEKAEKVIEAALYEKYGEEFVVDYIRDGYAGTMNSNILRGIARPKSDPSIRVTFEITKDLERVYDNYLNKVVAKNAETPIEALAQSLWPDSRIEVALDTNLVYPEHNDIAMSYEEFLGYYPAPITTLLIGVYLNVDDYIDKDSAMDQEGEMEKYLNFAKLLVEHKYVNSGISIIYLSPEAYGLFDEAKNADTSVSDFYRKLAQEGKKLNYITIVGYDINADGNVQETEEEIYRFFDLWEEKRTLYREKSDSF